MQQYNSAIKNCKMWNRVWIKNFSKNSKVFGTSTLDVYVLTYLWMHTPHPPNVGGGAQQADKNVKNDGKGLKNDRKDNIDKMKYRYTRI